MFALLWDIGAIVLPVFIVVAMGYAVKRSALVDQSFFHQLNRLVHYLALPLLLFYKIAAADFSASFNGLQIAGFAGMTVAVFAFSYGFAAVKKLGPPVRGTFSQCAFRGNLAYIGLAIVYNGYGEQGLASGGILLGFIVPLFNLFAIIALLLPHGSSRMHPLFFLQQIMINPLIISSFLGILWSLLDLPLPIVLDRSLDIVTGMALPLALISIGASFSLKKLRGDLKLAAQATAVKLIVCPVGVWVVYLALGVQGQDMAVGVLFAATPTATTAYIFSQQMRGDAQLAGAIIMLSTLISIATYTILLLFLKGMGV